MQFEFGGEKLFHAVESSKLSQICQHCYRCECLRPFLPMLESRGLLATFVELGSNVNATRVAQLAHKRNVMVIPLDAYYFGAPDRSGLLLGYGSLQIPDFVLAATVLPDITDQAEALARR